MFWSSQKIISEQNLAKKRGDPLLIDKFDDKYVGQGHYELSLSRQVLVSSNPDTLGQQIARNFLYPTKPDQDLSPTRLDEALTIPPGQFALIYTEEVITIPKNVLSLISIKAKVKLKGLVNISGFHVDPGFSGRIKFSVYNAGNRPICLDYGGRYFLVWFAELGVEADSKPYDKSHDHQGQSGITALDREQMAEPSQSPAALNKRLEALEQKVSYMALALTIVIIPLLLTFANVLFEHWYSSGLEASTAPRIGQSDSKSTNSLAAKP